MLHPVGGLAPGVYWRRRALLAAALVLVVLSIYALFFRGGGGTPPKSTSAFTSTTTTQPVASTPRAATPSTTPTPTPSQSSSVPAAAMCAATRLKVTAAVDQTSYPAGSKPKLALVVTNQGPAPCVADLSDSKIELRVYNGSARVWGSHDCAVQPGTSYATLPVGQQIRREIAWSGLSSTPGCAGVRQRVPAGNYTLFAYLNSQQGSIAKFSMAG